MNIIRSVTVRDKSGNKIRYLPSNPMSFIILKLIKKQLR